MSYENTQCPCGGKKPTDTMLCDDCETALADHPAMRWFTDRSQPVESRRNAAIVLVTAARQRKRKLLLDGEMQALNAYSPNDQAQRPEAK